MARAKYTIIRKIRATISKYGMLKRGDTVIAAVSGGVDSMALLHVLNGIGKDLNISIIACHLNHGLRGKESERDFRFVERACAYLGLKFEGRSLRAGELKRQGGSLQEAARTRRYEVLEDVAKKYRAHKIALGHTLDDQAETILMRFIKGSSSTGLAGIPPVRGPFIRPIIEIKREELERFVKEEGIGHVEDSSNLSPKYLRNDLRLNLIPIIRKYNPNLTETLVRMSFVLGEDGRCLDDLAKGIMPEVILKRGRKDLILNRIRLTELHRALTARVFLNSIKILSKESNTYNVHVESFLNIVSGKSVSSSLSLHDGLRVVREYDSIRITTQPLKEPKPFIKTVNVPGTTRLAGTGHKLVATILDRPFRAFADDCKTAYFDYAAVKKPMYVRSIRPGDRMIPFGVGGTKKLKEIFIEKKIPRFIRAEIPLLCHGDDILWAVCVRRSELLKVKKDTARILKIECVPALKFSGLEADGAGRPE